MEMGNNKSEQNISKTFLGTQLYNKKKAALKNAPFYSL